MTKCESCGAKLPAFLVNGDNPLSKGLVMVGIDKYHSLQNIDGTWQVVCQKNMAGG